MFGPAKSICDVEAKPPRGCTFNPSDWRILARFWHPVAFVHEVPQDKPVAARLLDVPLVVYRTSAGISVARDLCPHRGTQLSRGWIADDRLICPMHGLGFDDAGRCQSIPSMGDRSIAIPRRLDLLTVQSEIRYGIIWVCLLGDPIWPLPEWEGIGDPALENVYMPVETWQAAASRHVENFNDVAHFPFVHTGSFGGDPSVGVPVYQVRPFDGGLAFDMPYTEPTNRFPDGFGDGPRQVVYRYELTFPFSTIIKIDPEGSDYVNYTVDTVCPVSAHVSRIFQIATDTTGKPDRAYWMKDSATINDEDRPLVESQRPEDLPLDLLDEGHIPADKLSLEYRRALVSRFGLGAPIAS